MFIKESLLIYFDNVIEWDSTNWAALASLRTGDAAEVVATWDENSIAFSLVADLA